MATDRAYLISDRTATTYIWTGPGRHRSRRGTGRHRALPSPTRPARAGRPRALPAGVATLMTVFAAATALSGWFAATGASAVMGMIVK
jgi:hypothetical protein